MSSHGCGVPSPISSSAAGSWVVEVRILRVVIVDAHNDVLLELLIGGGEEQSLELMLRQGEDRVFERYWLPRLEAGGVRVQICPLYGASGAGSRGRRAPAQEAETASRPERASEVC